MSPAVCEWLASRGCVVYAEVPHYGSAIDHVGVCWETERLICVEMKVCLSRKVIYQAYCHRSLTCHTYAAVMSKPRGSTIIEASRRGIGVLHVQGNRVTTLLEPSGCDERFGHKRVIDLLKHLPIGGVGGNPCLKGVGPAQDVERAIAAYRMENPSAKWADIFRDVPNHYVSAKSMAGAMRSNEKRREYQARRRATT